MASMRLLTTAFLACVPLILLPIASRAGQEAADAHEAPASAAPRTVILVRHAEKEAAPQDPRDPGLSAAGAERARELARLLGASAAEHLFSSELRRTRDTLAPLAQALSLPVETVPAARPAELLARLDALAPGSVAVVCGHSNTLPRLAELLGVRCTGLVDTPAGPMLADASYDRVFVVTRPAAGPGALLELAYGAGATVSAGK